MNKQISQQIPTIYDLTQQLNTQTPIFPGDPPFSVQKIYSLEKGDKYNLCAVRMGNHMGTHIDYPIHVIPNSKNSGNFDLMRLRGQGLIVQIQNKQQKIDKNDIQNLLQTKKLKKGDIIFFKTPTSNSFLTPEAAKQLSKTEPKLVGISSMSIDSIDIDEEELPTHRILLEKQILIVENLQLDKCPAGRYYIYVVPIKIGQLDGLPVRVWAEPISSVLYCVTDKQKEIIS